MEKANRFFGTRAQLALERRADLLRQIVGDDPRYACNGRAVSVTGQTAEDAAVQIALARLQGVGPSHRLSAQVLEARSAEIIRAGLSTDIYTHWQAEVSAVTAARALVARRALPEELTVQAVDAGTSDEMLDRLDMLGQTCGMLLPAAAYLRGEARAGVCLYATTSKGAAVALSAAVAEHPPGSPLAGRVWWGLVCVAPDWRRQGIALSMGARAMIAMAERHKVKVFDTSLHADNTLRADLCRQLGFAPSGLFDLVAIDPVTLTGGRGAA